MRPMPRFPISAGRRRQVVRDLLITLGGRWVQMLIALAGNVLSARVLGPDDFGRFGLVMAS